MSHPAIAPSDKTLTTAETKQNTSPIFICSFSRSGTTLLTRILDSHSNLAIFHESDLYNLIYRLSTVVDFNQDHVIGSLVQYLLTLSYSTYQSPLLPNIDASVLHTQLCQSDRTPASIYYAVMQVWAGSRQRTRWGDKHSHYIDKMIPIYQDFPQAKFLHIVRDPRAVCSSMLKNPMFSNLSLHRMADSWHRAMRNLDRARKKIPQHQYYELHYEQLVQNPEAEIRKLCTFLEEPFEVDMLNFYKQANTHFGNLVEHHPGWNDNIQKSITTESLDKWKQELTPEQIGIIEHLTSPWLQSYGYTPISPRGNLPLSKGLFLSCYQISQPFRQIYRKHKWLHLEKTHLAQLKQTLLRGKPIEAPGSNHP